MGVVIEEAGKDVKSLWSRRPMGYERTTKDITKGDNRAIWSESV